MLPFSDPIAAVSTPRGTGGIAVIRVSGPGTAEILGRVFRPRGKVDPVQNPRRAVLGEIRGPDGRVLDEGLALFFPAPHSFTGEDVAELSCHGGALLTETVLAAVFAAGARPAEAGEFTRRALLGGKLTLTEAEALGALLDARTAGQLALARGGMAGRLSDALGSLYARLSALLADCYAKIDFPDEDLATRSPAEFLAAMAEIARDIAALADTWRTGRVVAEGVRAVLCGPVNAGKSSLYNALVGSEAAIVTDEAGTTRDILSATVALGPLTLRLSDTAGLRKTDNRVEQLGVARARAALAEAELILAVFDGSRPATPEDKALLAALADGFAASDEATGGETRPVGGGFGETGAETRPIIGDMAETNAAGGEATGGKTRPVMGDMAARTVVLLNKSDRGIRFGASDLLARFPHVLEISAKGDVEPLRALLVEMFAAGGIDLSGEAVVANARQYAALARAGESLGRAIAALEAGVPVDAACTDAELAMRALGEVDGREVDESILADIFSHFCVGK